MQRLTMLTTSSPLTGAVAFYQLSAGMSFLMFVIFYLAGGGDFHQRAMKCAVVSRPTIFKWVVPFVHKRPWLYLTIMHISPGFLW